MEFFLVALVEVCLAWIVRRFRSLLGLLALVAFVFGVVAAFRWFALAGFAVIIVTVCLLLLAISPKWAHIRVRGEPYVWFRPDGIIAAVDSKKVIRLYDASSGSQISKVSKYRWLRGWPPFIFTADGLYFTCFDGRGQIIVREWRTGKKIRYFACPKGCDWLRFNADGTSLASGGRQCPVYVWDWRTSQPSPVLEDVPWSRVFYTAISQDFRYLAGCIDQDAHLWDLKAQRRIGDLHEDNGVGAIVFSPSGHKLALATDGEIILREIPSGARTGAFAYKDEEDEDVFPEEMKFSPDGRYLVSTGGRFGPLSLWDLNTGARLLSWGGEFASPDFSPDGRQFVAKGYANTGGLILRWQLDDGRAVALLPL